MNKLYDVCISGLEGTINFSEFGLEARGKWASHSGYKSIYTGNCMTNGNFTEGALKKLAYEKANALFTENVVYAFLIGDEHKDFGWRTIGENLNGQVQIRLPDWHEGAVAQAIKEIGVTLECKNNNYWVFEPDISVVEAKAVLKPVLEKYSRFISEDILAERIRQSAKITGYDKRENQLALDL